MPNEQRKRVIRNRDKMSDHREFLKRINKSLYYGQLPKIPTLSLPVTELSSELFSESHKGKSLKRLHVDDAAELSRNACVSPCSLVLALLYLERLKNGNPEYLAKIAPADLFLVTLMVSNKYLQDDGEEDEVFCKEWATSGGVSLEALHQLERDFLEAIDWRLYVGESDFESYLGLLEHQVAFRQAKLRGWFSYADITNITTNFDNFSFMKGIFTVYLALSLSYVASVLTLIVSSYIVTHSSLAISTLGNLSSNNSIPLHSDVPLPYARTEANDAPSTNLTDESVFLSFPPVLYGDDASCHNKTLDFRIVSKNSWPGLHFETPNFVWQSLRDMSLLKIASKCFTHYFPVNSLHHTDGEYDPNFPLNDIFLNIEYPTTSWYTLTWQYPATVR